MDQESRGGVGYGRLNANRNDSDAIACLRPATKGSMKIEIEVTQDDIDRGVRNAVMSCPIARAVKRKGYVNPRVDGETISFYCADTEKGFLGNCTKRVERWIDRFDNSIDRCEPKPKPFKFTLNCHRLG